MADRNPISRLFHSDREEEPVLVVGLGRFGGALAATLVALGHEVLAIESSGRRVQSWAGNLTHVVEADATDVQVLTQLGASEFRRAVIAIGNDIEASVLATAALVDLGVKEIWAKAITAAHGRILERVGAHHVVFPEHDMGERVAHMVTGRMTDYIELDPGFVLVETEAPRSMIGRTLGESEVRRRYKVTVVCIKPAGQSFTYATADTVVNEGDMLLVAGETAEAEHFADLD